ncbi:hypothetical protein ACHAAC_04080 [Aeromicrobium sp. CF4.19]|uniref:hypothetical protein n=1 Tax=Aeromicrobium sp. CF4.19 TaxID=3373082 RepID=UPI003EE5A284
MARRARPTGPKPVEVHTHTDKRPNIPTADAQELVDPDLAESRWVGVERRLPTPELLWRTSPTCGIASPSRATC